MRWRLVCIVAMVFAGVVAASARGGQSEAIRRGGELTYTVRDGDTVDTIASRFGVSSAHLIELNELSKPYRIAAGQPLIVDNSHLAPVDPRAAITINIPQRMLFLSQPGKVDAFPVTVGSRHWPTPVGAFTIVEKERDPVWDVPVSIQREMAAQGKPVVTRVPPSPDNPLGAHWLRLSLPGIGIHGTNAPASIYRFVSHGCIRMHPEDVAGLFARVEEGTLVAIIYQPLIVAVIEGRIWLEANPDPYQRLIDPMRFVSDAAREHGVSERIDWDAVKRVVRLRRGRPVDVTRFE